MGMLAIFRRHSRTCKHRHKGRRWSRCNCPYWIQDGETRRSLGTRDQREAEKQLRQARRMLSQGLPLRVDEAIAEFLEDVSRRGLNWRTERRYRGILGRLDEYCKQIHCVRLDTLGVREVRAFMRSLTNLSDLTRVKELERLRSFFRFYVEQQQLVSNPALAVKGPRVERKQVQPFTHEEMDRILEACELFGQEPWQGRRMKALALLMRYSGLAISDAVSLPVDAVDETGRVRTSRTKTDASIYVMLPPVTVAALHSFPHASPEYYFWRGTGNLETALKRYRSRFSDIFKLAQVTGGHTHRFRHSFASAALSSGVPIDRVSNWLGHSSVRITERHYAAWVLDRQEELDRWSKVVFASDPLIRSDKNTGSDLVN